MREILYKAKRTDNGEWVEGYYFKFIDKSYITDMERTFMEAFYTQKSVVDFHMRAYEVEADTVCRHTGFLDKKGHWIWENDVAKDDRGNIYKAFWQDRYYQFSWICVKSDLLPIGAKWDLWSLSRNGNLEVIGNIFDNPELVERN